MFDALRFSGHDPVALEITPEGEYTPIKQFEGANSVVAARESMARLWARWLEAAGCEVPRDDEGQPTIQIEISPAFALTQAEFVARAKDLTIPESVDVRIDAEGNIEVTADA